MTKIQQIQKEIEKEIKSRDFYFNAKTDAYDNVIYFVSKNTSSLLSKICATIVVTSIANNTDINIDFILDERARELYWEGWRRNDQIRFGTFTGSWEFKNSSSDGHEVLYPIPATALASNPNLKQNAGY